jgi:hypothetical protein
VLAIVRAFELDGVYGNGTMPVSDEPISPSRHLVAQTT